MIKFSLALGTVALAIAPVAAADHSRYYGHSSSHQAQRVVKSGCAKQKDQDKVLGGIIGAVAGGVIGAAIADNNSDDRYRRRGHRAYRDYRGYRGHRGYHHNSGNNEVAGAVIGGVLGAVVGSSVAGSGRDCAFETEYADPAYAPTRSPYGPQWENSSRTRAQVYQQPQRVTTRTTRTVTTPRTQRVQVEYPRQPVQTTGECRTVQRETRLPDGGMVREPVRVCQDGSGRWVFDNELSGGARY